MVRLDLVSAKGECRSLDVAVVTCVCPMGQVWGPVGWLIILLPGVCWYILGYKPEPLPSYIKLRNCSYSIMLNYIDSLSTTQVHLPRPGTTIS